MIHLIANNDNVEGDAIVCMTLYEKCTLQLPFFTFRIIHKESREEIIFNGLDVSDYPEVYNRFIFKVVDSDPNPTLGVIVAPPGEYNYYVYESGERGILNIDQCQDMVEQGILRIEKSVITYPNYEPLNNVVPSWNRKNNN